MGTELDVFGLKIHRLKRLRIRATAQRACQIAIELSCAAAFLYN